MASLSDRLESLRVWFAAFVHEGGEVTPHAAAEVTLLLSDMVQHAGRQEDLLHDATTLLMGARTEALRNRASKFGAIDAALAAKGLSMAVMPASAILTEDHLEDGKVELFPRSWRIDRGAAAS